MEKKIWYKIFDSYEEACNTIGIDQIKKIRINEDLLALGRNNSSFFAISNSCPHEGVSLTTGNIKNESIECPFHNYHFNIKTGICTTHRCKPIDVFMIKIDHTGFYILK